METKLISFVVDGIPQPKGSKRASIRFGRAVIFEDNKKTKPWAAEITAAARRCAPAVPFDEPVEVWLHFRLPRLDSHFGTGRNVGNLRPSAPVWQSTKPDIDKLTRNALDALTKANFWKDDSRVASIVVNKIYCDAPGVTIGIAPIGFTGGSNSAWLLHPQPTLGVHNGVHKPNEGNDAPPI